MKTPSGISTSRDGGWEIDSGAWTESGLWTESGSWSDSGSWAESGFWPQSGSLQPESGVWGAPSGVWRPRRRADIRRDLKKLLRGDRFLHLTALILAAILFVMLAPGSPASWFAPAATLFLQVLALLAVVLQSKAVEVEAEERFWGFLALAIAFAMASVGLSLLAAAGPPSIRSAILGDAIQLGFFGSLLVALGSRPHLGKGWRERTVGVAIYEWGDLSFALVLFAYFAVIPATLSPVVYLAGLPSLLFQASMGAYVIGLAVYYGSVSKSTRWRWVDWMLAGALFLLLLGNLEEVGTVRLGRAVVPEGLVAYLGYVYLAFWVATARISRMRFERPLVPGGRSTSLPKDPLGGTSLLLSLLAVPGIHLAFSVTQLNDPATRVVRDVLVLVWLLAQGSIALIHQLRLQRRNRELRRAGQASQKELRFLVNHDPVTRLPNRAMLLELLEKALARTRRRRAPLAVLVVGLEGADDLVNALGRPAVEGILQEMTHRMRDIVRKADFLASLSPVEFAVILESIRKVDHVGLVARKLLERVQGRYEVDGEQVPVTVSVGASVAPTDGFEAESMLRNAMAARNHASAGNCHFYSEEMTRTALQRLTLETHLRAALERGHLHLAYQPKVELSTGRITGFEALARWSDPTLGEVSPGRFIPIAEDTGLVLPLGEWALREACQQLVLWRKEGFGDVTVAVNLSIRQFEAGDLALLVRTILDETGLEPEALELELTESLAMSEIDRVRDTLQRFDLEGIKLALDDFGTGFSSMSHLSELPFHSLKIDRSFVRRIGQGSKDETLVSTMVLMAQQLGLKVVAEGIETEQQRAFLAELACDFGQGFLFRPGVPAVDACQLLRQGLGG